MIFISEKRNTFPVLFLVLWLWLLLRIWFKMDACVIKLYSILNSNHFSRVRCFNEEISCYSACYKLINSPIMFPIYRPQERIQFNQYTTGTVMILCLQIWKSKKNIQTSKYINQNGIIRGDCEYFYPFCCVLSFCAYICTV